MMTFDEYLRDDHIKTLRDEFYHGHVTAEI
jgi:hypothetical protein